MTDIHAEVLGWVLDEIGRQRMGEEFGAAVTWAPMPAQTPQGVITVPGWLLLITARNPLLGEGPLHHMANLGAPRPVEESTRKEVASGLRMLRDLAASKLAGSNGHAPALAHG